MSVTVDFSKEGFKADRMFKVFTDDGSELTDVMNIKINMQENFPITAIIEIPVDRVIYPDESK